MSPENVRLLGQQLAALDLTVQVFTPDGMETILPPPDEEICSAGTEDDRPEAEFDEDEGPPIPLPNPAPVHDEPPMKWLPLCSCLEYARATGVILIIGHDGNGVGRAVVMIAPAGTDAHLIVRMVRSTTFLGFGSDPTSMVPEQERVRTVEGAIGLIREMVQHGFLDCRVTQAAMNAALRVSSGCDGN